MVVFVGLWLRRNILVRALSFSSLKEALNDRIHGRETNAVETRYQMG